MRGNSRRDVALGIIVVYIGVSGLSAFNYLESAPSDILLAVSTGATVLGALAAAVGLWERKSWALAAYIFWAVAAVTSRCVIDSRAEPVPWKVALGGVFTALFLLGLGAVVKHELAREA